MVTYHVKRIKDSSPLKSAGGQANAAYLKVTRERSEMLGSEMDDFEYDDGSSVAMLSQTRYCITKEEYPPELLRTFDIV